MGEVGDYAAFFTADGKMKHNGWSLPWWDGNEPLTARWLGLEAFLRDVPWAPFPSGKQTGPADTLGKSGWQMVRLVDVDYANPQMRDDVCREIERIIPKLRPDGIHADNLSDNNLDCLANRGLLDFGHWYLDGYSPGTTPAP